MSEFEDKKVEKQLKSFPKQEMSDEQVERMHADLMKAAASEDQKDKRRMLMRRIVIGGTSVAAIVLIAFLSMMIMNNNQAQNPESSSMDQANKLQEDESFEANEENRDSPGNEEGSTENSEAQNGSGGAQSDEEASNNGDNSDMTSESESSEESSNQSPEDFVLERADQIIDQLANSNYEAVAEHVHEDQGLLFSPYVNVSDEDLVFEANEVAQFASDESTYNWGNQDGSGKPIELKPMDYHNDYVFPKNYTSYDERNINKFKDRSGSTINNINEQFPDAHVVEYYVEGSGESADMNWNAINLVFEQNDQGEWKLVAIVNDQWTI
ncbi:hypothetical protein [Alkalibacillus almallahensis]|uniref:hypothetical protein n=1 Tax=Alkalibacillus almallahensis TaxID=1379154 RepID=UPI0014225627|nr:hypothetical protein [Alkalibacillus almallahensis]NIK13189.1 hypothetical protein [Alkalibacillus almallahensis]